MTDAMTWTQQFPLNRQPAMEDVDRFADNPLWPEFRQYLKDACGAPDGIQPVWLRAGVEPEI